MGGSHSTRQNDPNNPTVHEALSGPEREQYLESYESERSSQTRRGVFTCIRASEVPAGRRVLPSKVVFKKKLLADGSLDKYKARICVQGNLQRAGEDYDPGELFAPVARFTSLRVLVSLAAANGWKLRQFDIETAFLYADHGGCPDTGKSHSGYVCFLNNGPVSWMSKLQQPVAVSTTEAEYYAASYCASEIVFLRGILEDFQFEQKEPTLLLEDNQGAVCLMKNEVMFSRAKHINVRYHQLRDFVKKKIINVQHCRTDEMTADILTKLLPKATFEASATARSATRRRRR